MSSRIYSPRLNAIRVNPKAASASNLGVNSSRASFGLLMTWLALALVPWSLATPIEPTAKQLVQELERPAVKFVPARVGWTTPKARSAEFSLALEQYGPQATERAVRASVKVALAPDPIAMAALLFCAFALRFIVMRREQTQKPAVLPESDLNMPRVA
jgi:hypothetical protein